MEQPSREEIARVDRIHARADEALAQIKAGHIVTECHVLYEDEGGDVVWKAAELEAWAEHKAAMVNTLRGRIRTNHAIALGGRVFYGSCWEDIGEEFRPAMALGFVMYRESAVYLAAFPPTDPYAERRAHESAIERDMIAEGHVKSPRAETTRAFPKPARNPR